MEPPKNTPETAETERPPEPEATPVDGVARTEVQTPGKVATPVDPWIDRVLDARYRITERLGEGGMGAVFVAEHLKLRKQVALKMIRAELAGNGEVAARFAREAMATAQFEHPHVASAIDYGTLPEGGAYLVMQLVRGQSLRDLLEARGKLPWTEACDLLAQVADALSAARGAGIVHRDLKPENILVETREDGSRLAKILDFGIAHVAPQASAEPHNRELTRVGTVMGTPGYMAPEQAVGDRVDHRTDLYALGVVLWECIAGRPLWDGPDITTIIARQMTDEVPRLRELPALRVPRALDDLIQRLCARAANARPEHAGAVRDELRVLAHSARSSDRPVDTLRERWVEARGAAAQLPARTRALFALSAIAAVIGVVAIAPGAPREPEPAVAAPEPVAKQSAAGRAAPAPEPTLVQRAMDAARKVVEPAKPEPPKPVIPAELTDAVKTMLESSKATERRKAALRVLGYKGPTRLPPYVRAIAELEQGRTCRERKEAINAIITLGDTRCLESVRRLNDASRSGCGFLSLEDCYGCVRAELRKAVSALEAKLTN